MMPGDDGRAGRPGNDGWPRADDANWRCAGGRGWTGGRGWMTPAGGARAAEEGWAAGGGTCSSDGC
jgi:hypothetical protein